MTNREKAVEYMRRLDLIETVESNFNKGILMQSCGGAGILFPADERQQKRARELEEQFSEDNSAYFSRYDTVRRLHDASRCISYYGRYGARQTDGIWRKIPHFCLCG